MRASRTARRRPSVRLGVQALEARDVPAVLDVSVAGAEATANGALFRQADAVVPDQFDTFLRLRDNAGSREEGYNTDARPFQLDQRGDLTVTHSLQLSDIPTVTIDGVVYREFLLHIDEGDRARRQTISLDELRIFVGETGDLTGYNRRTHRLAGLTAVWDLDAGTNNTVVFRDGLTGAGMGDAVVLIPDAAFAGADGSDFVYLYSAFGGRVDQHGGAEEWGVRPAAPPPPPPPTGGSLSGYVYLDHDMDGLREPLGGEFGVPETGLGGFTLELYRTIDGQDVLLGTATTDAAGHYEFTGLEAGTYKVVRLEATGTNFFDLLNAPGKDGWGTNESNSDPDTNGADAIFNMVLAAGEQVGENNFGMGEAVPA